MNINEANPATSQPVYPEAKVAPREPVVTQPTPGRIVWYYPTLRDVSMMDMAEVGVPLAGIVGYVHDTRTVNLSVVTPLCEHVAILEVTLLQEGDKYPNDPEDGGFATWMPYQLAQAAKQNQEQASLALDANLKRTNDR